MNLLETLIDFSIKNDCDVMIKGKDMKAEVSFRKNYAKGTIIGDYITITDAKKHEEAIKGLMERFKKRMEYENNNSGS